MKQWIRGWRTRDWVQGSTHVRHTYYRAPKDFKFVDVNIQSSGSRRWPDGDLLLAHVLWVVLTTKGKKPNAIVLGFGATLHDRQWRGQLGRRILLLMVDLVVDSQLCRLLSLSAFLSFFVYKMALVNSGSKSLASLGANSTFLHFLATINLGK